MGVNVIGINAVLGRAAYGKACRIVAQATAGHAPALAKASGIYPRQLQAYGELETMLATNLRHPIFTLDRLIDALVEVLPAAEAQRRIALIAHHFADKAGGQFIPGADLDSGSIPEELAEKETAGARANVTTLRALADNRITRGEAEQIVAQLQDEMQESADLARAVVSAAIGGGR